MKDPDIDFRSFALKQKARDRYLSSSQIAKLLGFLCEHVTRNSECFGQLLAGQARHQVIRQFRQARIMAD